MTDDPKYACYPYKDLQANAMSIDSYGEHLLLAGRNVLAVIKLDDDCIGDIHRHQIPIKLSVTVIKGQTNSSEANLFALAYGSKADVYQLEEDGNLLEVCQLRSHNRTIGDLDWCPRRPNILATCSVDTFCYIWDVKEPRRPVSSLQAVSGAAQVKWNNKREGFLATSHEGDVRLWDPRICVNPVHYITAHTHKIMGLDWSTRDEFQMVTASQDNSFKMWDMRQTKQFLKQECGAPVWRARYTPNGSSLVTALMPTMGRTKNDSLLLWSLDSSGNDSLEARHIHSFSDHTDVILEFAFRSSRINGNNDYELITWCKDHNLRIWSKNLFNENFASCDPLSLESDSSPEDTISLSPHSLTPMPMSVTPDTSHLNGSSFTSQSLPRDDALQNELDVLNWGIDMINVERQDCINRLLIVVAKKNFVGIRLNMTFPEKYPHKAAPIFTFESIGDIDSAAKKNLEKTVTDSAKSHVRNGQSCIEPCLRHLSHWLRNQAVSNDHPYNKLESYGNSNRVIFPAAVPSVPRLPTPRTSGARFGGPDKLICFTRSFDTRRPSTTPRNYQGSEGRTPSSLSHFKQGSPPGDSALYKKPTSHSTKARIRQKSLAKSVESAAQPRQSKLSKQSKQSSKLIPVIIYDIDNILPISRSLGISYSLDMQNIGEACKKNSEAAATCNRPDLVLTWSLAGQIADQKLLNENSDTPWPVHPMARPLIMSLFKYYISLHDVQTVAMLSCAFHSTLFKPPSSSSVVAVKSPVCGYLPVLHQPYEAAAISSSSRKLAQIRRSNSCSELQNNYRFGETADFKPVSLLEASQEAQFDWYKLVYAELLYSWGLMDKRAELLKFVSSAPPAHQGPELVIACQSCNALSKTSPQCSSCHQMVLRCAVCRLSVRGNASVCERCGHGGHTAHWLKWFSNHTACPAGCSCICLS